MGQFEILRLSNSLPSSQVNRSDPLPLPRHSGQRPVAAQLRHC